MTWYLYSMIMIQYGFYCMCLCRQLRAFVIMIRWCFCDALIGSFALHDAWGTLELPSSQDSMSSTAWNRWMLLVSWFSCPGMVAPNVITLYASLYCKLFCRWVLYVNVWGVESSVRNVNSTVRHCKPKISVQGCSRTQTCDVSASECSKVQTVDLIWLGLMFYAAATLLCQRFFFLFRFRQNISFHHPHFCPGMWIGMVILTNST